MFSFIIRASRRALNDAPVLNGVIDDLGVLKGIASTCVSKTAKMLTVLG